MKNKIAIIDNGINTNLFGNEMIRNLVVDEGNQCREVQMVSCITDFQHGTICALILRKFCPDMELVGIKILDKDGEGEIEKIQPALEWCYQNDIYLINLSLGTTDFREYERLNRLINEYIYKGLIIIAAISNAGFLTYPASFTNIIGVSTIRNDLNYGKDYMQLGIDTIAPSEHILEVSGMELKTAISNSYATPYICALIANRIEAEGKGTVKELKEYAKNQSHIKMVDTIYDPDWMYKAYITEDKNISQAAYCFEAVRGNLEEVQEEVDTIITYSMKELYRLMSKNKNLIYLGKEDIKDFKAQGFFWSKETRQQQILYNSCQSYGIDIPLIIMEIDNSIDEFYILTKLKEFFAHEGYNAYTIGMKPESILYRLEYIPDMLSEPQPLINFIENQVYYKQSDLILWSVLPERKKELLRIYPNADMRICLSKNQNLVSFKIFFKGEQIESNIPETIREKNIEEIYHIIEKKLTED